MLCIIILQDHVTLEELMKNTPTFNSLLSNILDSIKIGRSYNGHLRLTVLNDMVNLNWLRTGKVFSPTGHFRVKADNLDHYLQSPEVNSVKYNLC